jgi:hypothetical protein
MQSTRVYSPSEWSDPIFRLNAIREARESAREISGKVIIKVKDGRYSHKVYEIAYVEQRNGFIINRSDR